MASPTSPTHGKLAALYVLRPNGFSGSGLNDVTWGAYTESGSPDSAYFEVVIDAEGTPDTFKWREDGGGWTTGVAITGASQDIVGTAGTQAITFAATTGHTLADQWVIGNLYAEATTVTSNDAQITDTTMRLINPNATFTWTPTNSVQHQITNYTNGTATFSDAPGVTTVTADDGFVPSAALVKVGYLIDWMINPILDMAEISVIGEHWKEYLPGQAGGNGSAGAYFIADETLYNCLAESIAAGDKYFLLQLFNYDPDQDQTGDHITAWVTFSSFNLSGTINDVVKESINFQIYGVVSFTANA